MFEKLFNRGTPPPSPQTPPLPLGFRLGGAVSIDRIPFLAHAGVYAFTPPEGDQIIEALGKVDLGDGAHLWRMYLTDDSWIQVGTTGETIEDLKVFIFADTKNPLDRREFQRWVEAGSALGAPVTQFAGHTYNRVWGDPPSAPWAPPIVYDEEVSHPVGGEADFSLTHYSMLYQRALVERPGRFEYLFISAEDSGPDEFCVVYSLGTDLTTADLSIT